MGLCAWGGVNAVAAPEDTAYLDKVMDYNFKSRTMKPLRYLFDHHRRRICLLCLVRLRNFGNLVTSGPNSWHLVSVNQT